MLEQTMTSREHRSRSDTITFMSGYTYGRSHAYPYTVSLLPGNDRRVTTPDISIPARPVRSLQVFQVRISDKPVKSMGDFADVLICLNKEAFDRNVSDLRRHGGVLIYDPSDFTPDAGDFITYPIPFNDLARKEVQLFQTKNMVMLG